MTSFKLKKYTKLFSLLISSSADFIEVQSFNKSTSVGLLYFLSSLKEYTAYEVNTSHRLLNICYVIFY